MVPRKHIYWGVGILVCLSVFIFQVIVSDADFKSTKESDSKKKNNKQIVIAKSESRVSNVQASQVKDRVEIDLLEKFKRVSTSDLDYSLKREERSRLILQISEKHGFEQAILLIDSEIGSGIDRSFLISKAFMGTTEEMTISLGRLNDLKPADIEFAIVGLYDRIKHQNLPDSEISKLLGSSLILSHKDQINIAISVDFLNSVDVEESKIKFTRLKKLIEDGSPSTRENLSEILLSSASRFLPFDAWELASTIDRQVSSSGQKSVTSETRKKIAEQMLFSDPSKALACFAASGSGGISFLDSGISRWLELNEKEALKWVQSNTVSLNSQQLAAITKGIAQNEAVDSNFKSAWERVHNIENSEIRSKAESQIWATERDAVTKAAKSDPSGTIESIISGKSQHEPYWIEAAMNQWVAKDSDAAWAWYEQNSRTLTPQQNEAVALSYARQALKNGQPDVASQWAAQVVTPKFKQKIAAEILNHKGAEN